MRLLRPGNTKEARSLKQSPAYGTMPAPVEKPNEESEAMHDIRQPPPPQDRSCGARKFARPARVSSVLHACLVWPQRPATIDPRADTAPGRNPGHLPTSRMVMDVSKTCVFTYSLDTSERGQTIDGALPDTWSSGSSRADANIDLALSTADWGSQQPPRVYPAVC